MKALLVLFSFFLSLAAHTENIHSKDYIFSNHKMHLIWSGDENKKAVVFVHGSPSTSEAWLPFLENEDLQKNFQLIAVDRPGFGGSDEGGAELSLQAQAAAVFAAIKVNRSHQKPILVGHSFGCDVIARIAMDFSNEISGLVFASAPVDPKLEEPQWWERPLAWHLLRFLVPNFFLNANDETVALKSELEKMLPLWTRITAPAIILQGTDDSEAPIENVEFLKAHLSNIKKIEIVPGLDHALVKKRPDLILQALTIF